VKVMLERSGGFAAIPGLSRAIVVDTSTEPPAVASELEGLVEAAQIPTRPRHVPAPSGAADHYTYRLTVERAGHTDVVQFPDPIADQALQALVARVQELDRDKT